MVAGTGAFVMSSRERRPVGRAVLAASVAVLAGQLALLGTAASAIAGCTS